MRCRAQESRKDLVFVKTSQAVIWSLHTVELEAEDVVDDSGLTALESWSVLGIHCTEANHIKCYSEKPQSSLLYSQQEQKYHKAAILFFCNYSSK